MARNTRYAVQATACALLLVACTRHTPQVKEQTPEKSVAPAIQSLLPIAGVTIADDFPDYTSEQCKQLCDTLRAAHTQWVAIVAAGYLPSTTATTITWTNWSRRNYAEGIRTVKQRGLRVLFKPYLWSHEFWTKKMWTGVIVQPDSTQRRQWFASYTTWMLDNARYAQQGKADMLCIGLELPGMCMYEREWRALIDTVRTVYSGALVYAAHGMQEAKQMRFWDALDCVGVNIYPTLSASPHPTDDELRNGWQSYQKECAALFTALGKPIIFTEAGFRSVVGAAYKPWEWPEHAARPANDKQQEQAYKILAEQCYHQPWFGGIFWWKFFTAPEQNEGPDGFSPQGKPAFAQMARDFGILAARVRTEE